MISLFSDGQTSSGSLQEGENPSTKQNHHQQPNNNSIETTAGVVAGQFSCIYEGVNGILYAGSKCLYFVGTYFLFDKKLHVPWEMILRVVRLEHGIQVVTKGDDTYSFLGMLQPLRVWPLLVSLHNDALLGRPVPTAQRGRADSVEGRGFLMKRRNSDPAAGSTLALDATLEEQTYAVELEHENQKKNQQMKPNNQQTKQRHKQPDDRQKMNKNKPPSASPRTADASRKHYQVAVAENSIEVMAAPPLALSPKTSQSMTVLGFSSRQEAQQALGELKLPPIPCRHGSRDGTMYVGQDCVYFYAQHKVWFWDVRRLFFKFGSIRQVQILAHASNRRRANTGGEDTPKPPAVSAFASIMTNTNAEDLIKEERQGIVITHRSGQVFEFENMMDPDKVWASLLAIQNENLLHRRRRNSKKSKEEQPSTTGGHHAFFVRMNSDPDLAAQRETSVYHLPALHDDDENDTPGLSLEDNGQHESNDTLSPLKTPQAPTEIMSPPTPEFRRGVSDPGTNTPRQLSPIVPPKLDMQQEWSKLQQEQKAFPHSIVKSLQLACSLNDFVEKFLANDAPYSIPKYLESRGDSSLRASEWQPSLAAVDVQSKLEQNRVIRYEHPVNAPLAPPKAGARKEQTLTRYGNVGLCLETRTIVDDVPMADCFYVQDRICVEKEEQGGVVVNMEFEITFIKSTMFKSIISKTTQSEFSDFFKQMASYMTKALGQETTANTGNKPDEPTDKSELVETPADTTGLVSMAQQMLAPHLTSILLAWVLLLQLYILLELRDIRETMAATSSGNGVHMQECVVVPKGENDRPPDML